MTSYHPFPPQGEGYIKFKAVWQQAPPLPAESVAALAHWRDEMHRLCLIGVYENGIGYGNISQRAGGHFIITGSATGHLASLSPLYFTTVTGFDLQENTVYCTGPIVASSESMSHAALYQSSRAVGGVIHAHHAGLWQMLLDSLPATAEGASYGSPEMAKSVIDLMENSVVAEEKIFAMKSHEEGIFSFGADLEEAATILKKWLALFQGQPL